MVGDKRLLYDHFYFGVENSTNHELITINLMISTFHRRIKQIFFVLFFFS